jgi:pyruvate/2-oxoglutarate dehydrogenase complex dihydrolipoamide acyltransferase (E2) component
MSWADKLRAQFAAKGDHVTVTAILLKAIATAQRLNPQSLQGYLPFNMRVNYHEIVAGFTVERFVGKDPAVFFGKIEKAEYKSLPEIAAELREYGTAQIENVPVLNIQNVFTHAPSFIRKIVFHLGSLIPALRLAVNNATFGLTTLGKYGVVTAFGPCVCACTFGVGTVEDRAVVRDGEVCARPMMTIAMSYDHRLIDSVPAAMFLRDVKDLVEGKMEDFALVGIVDGSDSLATT